MIPGLGVIELRSGDVVVLRIQDRAAFASWLLGEQVSDLVRMQTIRERAALLARLIGGAS